MQAPSGADRLKGAAPAEPEEYRDSCADPWKASCFWFWSAATRLKPYRQPRHRPHLPNAISSSSGLVIPNDSRQALGLL